jgi:Ca-activated chloride channel family protein
MNPPYHKWRAAIAWLCGLAVVGSLATGTIRDPNFWRTPEQRGDQLLRAGRFKEAAEVYRDPFRIGVAQYRNGDFEAAAKTFVRVPGAIGAYDAANALLMHGNYEAAIASYDRALLTRLGWQEAEENKTIAVARRKVLEGSDRDREQESTDDDEKPDEIVIDQKGENKNTPPDLAAEGPVSDADLQATWLRRVQTTPGAFLKIKFSYQAAHLKQPDDQ